MYKNINIVIRIALILSFITFSQFDTFGQKGIIITVPEVDTLVLRGAVNVLHCPNHYYQDSTFVDYVHYIVIYKQHHLIRYHEIFDSEMRDRVAIDSYHFSIENDTMYFFSEKEFLNFTGLGKTLFLSYPTKTKSMNITPRKLKSDTIQKWGVDTSYFHFFEFNENIIKKTRNFSLDRTKGIQKVKINLFESSKLKWHQQEYNGFHKYNAVHNKTITGEIDSTRFYSTLVVDNIRSLTKEDSQCTTINANYVRIETLPTKFLPLLK